MPISPFMNKSMNLLSYFNHSSNIDWIDLVKVADLLRIGLCIFTNIFRFFPRFVVTVNHQKCGHCKLPMFIWLLLPYWENLKSSDQTMMFLTLLLTLLLLPGLQTWQAHSPGLYHPVSAHFVSLLLSIEPLLTLVVNLIFRLFPLFPMISLA